MQRQRRGNNGNLQAQVSRLTQMVESLTVGRRQRSRSRRRTPARTPAVVQVPAATSRNITRGPTPAANRRPNSTALTNSGTIRFSNRELFHTISLDSKATGGTWGETILVSAGVGDGFLSKLGKLFGRYRWLSLDFEYESMVSSATDGVLAYGLDWGCTTVTAGPTATTLAKVTALNPSISHPFWESRARMPKPSRQRLNARVWYDTDDSDVAVSSLATMWLFLSGAATSVTKNYGAIWINYTVEMQGPHI